jgi:radical SAM superfamily enzyme
MEDDMETIFEHNVTKLEIEMLTSCAPHKGMKNKENYVKYCDVDTMNADLYRLFTIRNQADKAESYIKKVKEQENIVYFF